ncbi:MAG: PhnD/SsuA/transferrin family substrate-binding protein, partial [Acidiferrobacterales bacterium]
MSGYKTWSSYKTCLAGLALVCASPATFAADTLAGKKSQIALDGDVIIFTAPPRENLAAGEAKYAPVADYLTKVLKKRVVYKHPGTWGVYRTEMLKGKYDIVFDGPHFNSYRAEKLQHNILVKIPIRHEFVVIVRKGEKRFNNIEQLAGRTFCT